MKASQSQPEGTRSQANYVVPAASPSVAALPVDQFSGDLLCPFCGEPLLLTIERTEDGPETMGHCAACVAVVQVEI